MFELLWDIYLQKQVGDLSKQNADIGESATQANAHVTSLEHRYDQLRLINMALWNLLKERLHLTDADLQASVEALRSDPQAAPLRERERIRELIECTACKRKIPAKAIACIYCGEPTVSAGTFKTT